MQNLPFHLVFSPNTSIYEAPDIERNRHTFSFLLKSGSSEAQFMISSYLSRRQSRQYLPKNFFKEKCFDSCYTASFSPLTPSLPYPNMMQDNGFPQGKHSASSTAAASAVKLICCLYTRLTLNKSASCCVLKYELNWPCIFYMLMCRNKWTY